MLAPGLATMLVRAHHRRGRRRRRRWTRRCARPCRVTFDRVDSDGCMSTNDTVLLLASGASGVDADRGRADRRRHRGLPRPGPAAARRRRGRHQGRSRSRSVGAADRGRRGRGRPRRSPATTWSRPRCSATTPTGAGSSPRSAPPPPRSSPTSSTWPSTASGSAGAARPPRTASKVDLSGRAVTIRIDLHAGAAGRDGLDQRPVARVRARELGVLDMSARRPEPATIGIAPRRKAATLIEALPWLARFHGAPSWSSTAATR